MEKKPVRKERLLQNWSWLKFWINDLKGNRQNVLHQSFSFPDTPHLQIPSVTGKIMYKEIWDRKYLCVVKDKDSADLHGILSEMSFLAKHLFLYGKHLVDCLLYGIEVC